MKMNFSSDQQKVIGIDKGYNMVLAGPGCGKTEILAERIAQAFEQEKVKMEDVLCLTFTNRAARGMYRRIQNRLGDNATGLFVGNIHRFCSHFLFDNEVIPKDSFIIDEDDTAEIVESEISDNEIKKIIGYSIEYHVFHGNLVELIHPDWGIVNSLLNIDIHPSGTTGGIKEDKANKIVKQAKFKILQLTHVLKQMRNGHSEAELLHEDLISGFLFAGNFISLDQFSDLCKSIRYDKSAFNNQSPAEQALALADRLLAYKTTHHFLDFDDLLIDTYDAYLHDYEQKFKRYPWVQVDETQDLSRFQIALVDLLTQKSDDFVALYLGDEQQAIYSFIGASLDTLYYLKERCKGNIYRLYKNFRSPKYLLDLYNDYAVKELHVDRDLLPTSKDDAEAQRYDICLHIYPNIESETKRIREAILPYLTSQSGNETTAILVPWNSDATELSDQLKHDNVPHFKISGMDTFQTVTMRTLLAHFNVTVNEYNAVSWSRILKQTFAVDTYAQGRDFIEKARKCAMTPADLLLYNDGTTYLSRFCDKFDQQTIVLFDTETTGVDVFSDDIVQIAAVKIRNGEIIPDSEFCVFLQTEKTIPEMLGDKVNPMKEAYEKNSKLPREEGLLSFVNYIGDCELMGHNVNFDCHILRNNLRRDCPKQNITLDCELIDTLKIAHLLFPDLHKYKLESLLEEFGLEGSNSHMADDDIIATFEVAKFFRREAVRYLPLQKDFLLDRLTIQVREELEFSYKECYFHTLNNMYEENCPGIALIEEMKYAHAFLQRTCEIRPIENFDIVVDFLSHDVIQDEPNILQSQLSNHLVDIGTYREADLCDSPIFKEKLFISTVHKAKGLEFDNVIVMRAVVDRYPSFAHQTAEKQDEDKRLFYVALSRAKKRLVVSTSHSPKEITPYIEPVINHFCVRFLLFNNLPNGEVLAVKTEIFREELQLVYQLNGKVTQYVFPSLQLLYEKKPRFKNPLALKYFLMQYSYEMDTIQRIVNLMESCGITCLKA